MKYSVSIDVPNLEDGLRFYRDALGLAEIVRPIPTVGASQARTFDTIHRRPWFDVNPAQSWTHSAACAHSAPLKGSSRSRQRRGIIGSPAPKEDDLARSMGSLRRL